MMYVVGATKAEKLKEIEKLFPDHFFWFPVLVHKGEVCRKLLKTG